MAFTHSPKIVTSGLVMMLDTVNSKSYVSGSRSIVNLATGITGSVSTSSYFSATVPQGVTPTTNGIFLSGSITEGGCIVLNDVLQTTYPSAINGWFTVADTSSLRGLINLRDENYGGAWNVIAVDTSGSVYVSRRGGFGAVYDTTGSFIQPNVYFNTHANFQSSTLLEFYLNGQLQYSGSVSGIDTSGSIVDVIIGAFRTAGPEPWNFHRGLFGQGLVYNRTLNKDEVLQNFNALRGRYGI